MIRTPMTMSELHVMEEVRLRDNTCFLHFGNGNFRISGVVLEWPIEFKDDLWNGVVAVEEAKARAQDWFSHDAAISLARKIELTPRF